MSDQNVKARDPRSVGLDVSDHAPEGGAFPQVPWDRFDAADLGPAVMVPTMLNMNEQSFYVWLGRNWATGQGAIVDLGSFAGGSAACLAEGVAQSGRDQRVQGYDKFDLQDYGRFQDRCLRYWASPPASLSSFSPATLPDHAESDLLPLVRKLLAPWQDRITLHKGQIEEAAWTGGPIELLVMDASKTASTMDQMSATFFPHLIPGRSIVVQQDYLWRQQPWIAAQMALLQDYFVPVAFVPGASVSFLCIREVPQAVMSDLSVAAMRDGQIIRAIRQAQEQMQALPIERGLRRLIRAVRENPGVRRAARMGNA